MNTETSFGSNTLLSSLIILFGFSLLSLALTGCIDNKCLLRANTCQNGGECENGDCNCPPGYYGEDCEYYEPCSILVCENGGTCDEYDGQCNCLDGYEGTHCETEERAKFLGSYLGYGKIGCWGEPGYTPVSDVAFSIEVDPNDVISVLVHFDGQLLEGEVDGYTMTVMNQAGNNFYNYSAGASLYDLNDSLSITFHKKYFEECSYYLKAVRQ